MSPPEEAPTWREHEKLSQDVNALGMDLRTGLAANDRILNSILEQLGREDERIKGVEEDNRALAAKVDRLQATLVMFAFTVAAAALGVAFAVLQG